MTTKLYQKDVYLREWDSKITSIRRKDAPQTFEIILEESAFFPEGGGQSCDLGTVSGYQVLDVQEEGDDVIHTVAFDEKATLPALKEGDIVHCLIDWDRRFDNMQRHCGEHILSGIFFARCGGVNRGFHMGTDYMTIDISLEEEPGDADAARPDKIDMELALDCERRANEVIWSDAPVTVYRFDERDEIGDMPLRKALAFDEDISIVCVGSPENASDCVACCGTHPSSAGQVGLIKIYKVENYKGMFRIYFEAGARALEDYDNKHRILTTMANDHSSSVDELADTIRAQEEKLASAKDALYHAKRALIRGETEVIEQLLGSQDSGSNGADSADDSGGSDGTDGSDDSSGPGGAGYPILVHRLEDLSLDDAFELAKAFMGKVSKLLMLYAVSNTSFILVSSGEPHCGDLVREYASFYKGKGGGNDISARAIFSSEEDAMLFADLIAKHLT